MSNKKRKIYVLIIIIFVFNFIYILNNKTGMILDDFTYHFTFSRFPNKNTKLITNPIEIFGSMVTHWKVWGGRIATHSLLQLTFMFKITIFNVINSLMFVLLGLLVYKNIDSNKEIKPLWLILIYEAIFLFIPQPSYTLFWKSGSANYLWASVFLLCMSMIYKKYYDDKNSVKDNKRNMIFLFILGLIVGNSNENVGCAFIIVELLFINFFRKKYKLIPRWAHSSLIATSLGYMFLIIAPGNYIRTDNMHPKVLYGVKNTIKYLLELTKLSDMYLIYIFIAFIFSSILLLNKQNSMKEIIEKFRIQIYYLIFSIVSIYSLILSPIHPERCWTFTFMFLLISVGINLTQILKKNYVIIVLTFLLALITINEYSQAYRYIENTKQEVNKQIQEIYQQKNEGRINIIVPKIRNAEGKYNVYTDLEYLNNDHTFWVNLWMAKYYDVNSIIQIE